MARKIFELENIGRVIFNESIIKQYLFSAALQDFVRVKHYIDVMGLHPDTTLGGKPTALCYAVLKQDRCLMHYLNMRGADVNSIDRMGMSPIHYAALGGCCYCVSYLVHSGSDIDAKNTSGKSALELVEDREDLQECAEQLRRYSHADINGIRIPSSFH